MTESTPKNVPGKTVFTPLNCLVVAIVAGLGFLALSLWVSSHGTRVPAIDQNLHSWVMHRRNHSNITLARTVTWGGVTTLVLPLLIIIVIAVAEAAESFTRRLRAGLIITVVAGAGALLGLQINHLEGRIRPPVADWAGVAGGPSFPSGHTTVATIFAASSAWAISSRLHLGWPRVALWTGAIVYAIAVGLSRIWLGVHWPTDVVGGWLYGLTWLSLSASVVLALRRRRARLQAHIS